MTEHPTEGRRVALDNSEPGPTQPNISLNPSSLSDSNIPTSTSSSPVPSAKYTLSDLVTLKVGSDERELVVCGQLLVKTSEFFRAALKKKWKEGQTRIVKLPDDSIEHVTYYLDFVYGEGLSSESCKRAEDLGDVESNLEPLGLLINLYNLSERVLNITIKLAIIKEMVRLVSMETKDGGRLVPSLRGVQEIYKSTTDGSPARRLVVDLYVAYAQPGTFENADDNPAFLRDVAESLLAKAASRQSSRDFRYRELNADDYLVR